jgi:hypothetical protein
MDIYGSLWNTFDGYLGCFRTTPGSTAELCRSVGLTPMEVAVQSKQELDGTWWWGQTVVGKTMP